MRALVCVCVRERDFNAAEGALLSNFILLSPGLFQGVQQKAKEPVLRVSRGACARTCILGYAVCTQARGRPPVHVTGSVGGIIKRK